MYYESYHYYCENRSFKNMYYWCKVCRKHWYQCSVHNKDHCNYQQIIDMHNEVSNNEYYLVENKLIGKQPRQYYYAYSDDDEYWDNQEIDDEYSLDHGCDETNYNEEENCEVNYEVVNCNDQINCKDRMHYSKKENSIKNDCIDNSYQCDQCNKIHHKEFEFCEKCKKCLPTKIFTDPHCDYCITDPHHISPSNMIPLIVDGSSYCFDRIKESDRLYDNLGGYEFLIDRKYKFFRKRYKIGFQKREKRYCDKCLKCHYIDYSYCKECDKCYNIRYLSIEHCDSPDCVDDPHRVIYFSRKKDNICISDNVYWCKICSKHWKSSSLHCREECNYLDLINQKMVILNNNSQKISCY